MRLAVWMVRLVAVGLAWFGLWLAWTVALGEVGGVHTCSVVAVDCEILVLDVGHGFGV